MSCLLVSSFWHFTEFPQHPIHTLQLDLNENIDLCSTLYLIDSEELKCTQVILNLFVNNKMKKHVNYYQFTKQTVFKIAGLQGSFVNLQIKRYRKLNLKWVFITQLQT